MSLSLLVGTTVALLTHSGEATQFPAELEAERPLFNGGRPSEREDIEPTGLLGGDSWKKVHKHATWIG